MGSSGALGLLCCVFILIELDLSLVFARPNYPIVVPRGQRKQIMNDHMYFIGKRDKSSGTNEYTSDSLAERLRITDEKIADAFLQNQCFGDSQCPDTHCCALFQAERRQNWAMGTFRHPMAQCVPLGFNGDMCFFNTPGVVGVGCGCSSGLKCITFAGYGFGVCVEDK